MLLSMETHTTAGMMSFIIITICRACKMLYVAPVKTLPLRCVFILLLQVHRRWQENHYERLEIVVSMIGARSPAMLFGRIAYRRSFLSAPAERSATTRYTGNQW